MQTTELIKRRNDLFQLLAPHSIAVLYSGVPLKKSADADFPFVANQHFFYLTGINQDHCALLMIKTPQTEKMVLLVDAVDPLKTRWVGHRLSVTEAISISGIQEILFMDQLDSKLQEILKTSTQYGRIDNFYLDFEKNLIVGTSYQTAQHIKENLSISYPALKWEDVYPLVVKLRMIKSSSEIDALKKAIAITKQGLDAVHQYLKPGIYEYQLESLFSYRIGDLAHAPLSFETIIASGKNAIVLHYPHAQDLIQEGVLVLCDLGAKFDGYSADITRTYPASKVFNPLQKQIYDIVLGANKMLLKMAKPGIKLIDLQNATIDYMAERCVQEGLIKTKDNIKDVYYHNCSHHLGLDTHDPAQRELPLVAGNVITIEPGLYFKEFGIGVRIEDDALITDNGCINLSASIPKEISEIEKR
jgi:Xaa-Pro aminopeptidase